MGLLPVLATGVTALLAGRLLGRGSVVAALLAGFVVAYAELVVLELLLSVGDHLTLPWLTGTTVVVAAVTVVLHQALRPSAVGLRRAWSETAALVRGDRLLLVLLALTATILAYDLALAVLTPPAEGDAIGYHLSRAAYWLQFDGLGGVPGNTDPHIDSSPPGAELVVAFTMLVSHGIRFVSLVQYVSLLATCVAIVGLGRRLGLAAGPVLFAALLYPTASIVLMQAPTGLNDVVAAAFVAIAAFFLLGRTRLELALGGAAVACLAITKVTGSISLGVLLVVLAAVRGRRCGPAAVVAVVAMLPAAVWAALAPETRGADAIGGIDPSLTHAHHNRVVTFLARLSRLTTEAIEVPGGAHRDIAVYGIAAVVTAVVLAVWGRVGRRTSVIVPLAIASTMLFAPFASLAWRSHRKAWSLVGAHWAEVMDVNRPLGRTDTAYTWYGPVVVVLVVASVVTLARRPGARRLALVAGAPVISMALLAIVLRFVPTAGRYMMGPVAISAGTWGVVLARRGLALWAVPTAAATALLAVVHFGERPLGIRLFDGPAPPSVWTRPYSDGIGFQRGAPGVIRFTDRVIAKDARLGLSNELLALPFFGRKLTRTILPVDTLTEAERADVDWAILVADAVPACRDGWTRVIVFREDYAAFRRSPGARCRLESG